MLSKLAVILYDESISNQWIGVEQGKKEDFDGRDIYAVFSIGFKEKDNTSKDPKEENKDKIAEHALKDIFVSNFNPFLDIINYLIIRIFHNYKYVVTFIQGISWGLLAFVIYYKIGVFKQNEEIVHNHSCI